MAIDRILRRQEVEQLTGLSRSTLYRQVRRGAFPSPVRITERLIGWHESAIRAWLDQRPV